MVVSERILNEMERREVSQLELSKMTGINRSVLNRIILGTRPARDEEIALIANALNISADYLLGIKPKEQYELKKVTPHGFRHTHCSLLIEWGYSIKKIQLQMGHDNIETTLQIYSHVANRINTGVATLLNKKVDF